MKNLESYRVFRKEYNGLKKLHYSAKYSINKLVEINSVFDKGKSLDLVKENGVSFKGPFKYKQREVSDLERLLNRQSLVSAITLLEVFFTDIYRDIFVLKKFPFKDDSRIYSFSSSQLLSTNTISEIYDIVINNECRQLTSGGIKEIIKKFKKRFNIDLLNIMPGSQKIIEYHDIRHIIVHRAGKTDEHFRKKYQTRKSGISISNDYIEKLFVDIDNFVKRAHKLVLNYIINVNSNDKIVEYDRILKIKIEIKSIKFDRNIIDKNYEFWVNEKFEVLKNILLEITQINDITYELKLAGKFEQIKSYMKLIKYQANIKKIDFSILEDIINEEKNRLQSKKNLDNETIQNIRDLLPSKPRPIGIHKAIAHELGLSNAIVYKAIYLIENNMITEERE